MACISRARSPATDRSIWSWWQRASGWEIWRSRREGTFLRRLASFGRLIVLDRRGTGLSDHVIDRIQQLSLEKPDGGHPRGHGRDRSTRAVLLALESGGFPVAAMFAATLPERTAGLIAYGSTARDLWARDYPFGDMPEKVEAEIVELEQAWGTEDLAASIGDQAWARLVTEHHRIVRGHLARYRGNEMDTAGDGFYATFDGPARAVRCAQAIAADVRTLSIEIRAGVHAGEMQTIDGSSAASRSPSVPASPRWRGHPRFWCRRPCGTWSPAQGWSSKMPASTS
ncbi:MAG: hypothetical protein ACRDH7_01965 [Actinomycetota bacterium]